VTDRHRRLADALPEPALTRIADLGCGEGHTLLALRERFGPGMELVGVERREPTLVAGLEDVQVVVADLNKTLPFEDASLGAAVCHNTLEALTAADAFLAEVARVLAPGGHFLLSHTDLDTLVFHASDLDLTRRFVHAYADTQEEWMDAADGTIGRKLPSIARRSPFELVATYAWVEVDTDFAQGEIADRAVDGIKAAVRRDHRELASQLEAWVDDLRVHAGLGEFLFSVNDYAVLLRRPG
jgi:ubiquinone/menaquinone biosynthesis C-methylase UbiE